jgi:hypothetical protein
VFATASDGSHYTGSIQFGVGDSTGRVSAAGAAELSSDVSIESESLEAVSLAGTVLTKVVYHDDAVVRMAVQALDGPMMVSSTHQQHGGRCRCSQIRR